VRTNFVGKLENFKYNIPRKSICYYDEDTGIWYSKNLGKWKCLTPASQARKNSWSSAYTWISLDFCKNNQDKINNLAFSPPAS